MPTYSKPVDQLQRLTRLLGWRFDFGFTNIASMRTMGRLATEVKSLLGMRLERQPAEDRTAFFR